jgi:threonine dehydratase
VLSGGNIDIGMISTLARRHETQEGRRLFIAVKLADRPGELAIFLRTVGDAGANVVEVQHIREGIGIRPWETVIQLILDVRSPEHARELLDYISSAGFHARELT